MIRALLLYFVVVLKLLDEVSVATFLYFQTTTTPSRGMINSRVSMGGYKFVIITLCNALCHDDYY